MTNTKMRISLITMSLMLASCAGTLGWGKPYEIVLSNPKSITFNYDSFITNLTELGPIAQAHCQKHSKDAVPQPQVEKVGIRTVTFLCE